MTDLWKQAMTVYRHPHFDQDKRLVHGHFTREGGVSAGPFASLNVSGGVGDEAGAVVENRRRIAACLGGGALLTLQQVHGTEVLVWTGNRVPEEPVAADAVITDEPGILLTIQTADCQAVMVHDPVRQVVGNIHAGWRGSVGNIIGKTIAVMIRRFGCNPADLRAGIGPSLGPCCAEFVNYKTELPETFWAFKDQRDHVDFWRISETQLKNEGLRPEHIAVSGLCTKCNKDLFFSYRRDKVTGRLAHVIGLAL
jgi:hypothetical protein